MQLEVQRVSVPSSVFINYIDEHEFVRKPGVKSRGVVTPMYGGSPSVRSTGILRVPPEFVLGLV
jgi:hypothetical protein